MPIVRQGMSDILKFNRHRLEHIDIEITRDCNLDCYHCSAGTKRTGKKITRKEIKDILSEAKSLGLKKVGFTGVEPLKYLLDLQDITHFA